MHIDKNTISYYIIYFCISNKLLPFVSGINNNVNIKAKADEHEKDQNNMYAPTTFINVPKAVDTMNPLIQELVMATAEPLLLTLVLNISPINVLGIIPRPKN